MPAIGVGLAWLAYTAGLWGYCLVRGYNVTLKQLLSSQWPPDTSQNTRGGIGGIAQQAINAINNPNTAVGKANGPDKAK